MATIQERLARMRAAGEAQAAFTQTTGRTGTSPSGLTIQERLERMRAAGEAQAAQAKKEQKSVTGGAAISPRPVAPSGAKGNAGKTTGHAIAPAKRAGKTGTLRAGTEGKNAVKPSVRAAGAVLPTAKDISKAGEAAPKGTGDVRYLPAAKPVPERSLVKPISQQKAELELERQYGDLALPTWETVRMTAQERERADAARDRLKKRLDELEGMEYQHDVDAYETQRRATLAGYEARKDLDPAAGLRADVRQGLDVDEKRNAARKAVFALQQGMGGGDRLMPELDYMTQKEKETLLGLAGIGRWDWAGDYYDALKRELNARSQGTASEKTYREAKENPVLGAAANVGYSFLSPLAYAANLGQMAKNAVTGEFEPVDTNSPLFQGAHGVQDTQQGVHEAAAQWGTERFGETGGRVTGFLADTGLSILQNLAQMPLGKGTALLTMSASAAGNQTLSDLQAGATPDKAALSATMVGAVEYLTEMIPMDNLFKLAETAPTSLRQLVTNILKQMGAEGLGEMTAEVLENGLNYVIYNGTGISDYEQAVAELTAQGQDRETAEKNAFLQIGVVNTLLAGVGGALSGGVLGAGGQAVGILRGRLAGGQQAVQQQTAQQQPQQTQQRPVERMAIDPETNTLPGNWGKETPVTERQMVENKILGELPGAGYLTSNQTVEEAVSMDEAIRRDALAPTLPKPSDMNQARREGGKNVNAQESVIPDLLTEESKVLPLPGGERKTASTGETVKVVQKLRESIPQFEGTAPVSSVSTAAVQAVEGRTMAEKARKIFERVKGIVVRQGFGEVEIDNRAMKDDLSHGVGVAKAATISVIPEVIKKGRQIDFQSQWKGRPYDSYTFAAPVTMDGKTVYVAAVVKQTSKNRFYLHEVVDSNGNIIKINNGEGANQTSLVAESDAGTQSPLLTDTIIPQTGEGVKGKYAQPGEVQSIQGPKGLYTGETWAAEFLDGGTEAQPVTRAAEDVGRMEPGDTGTRQQAVIRETEAALERFMDAQVGDPAETAQATVKTRMPGKDAGPLKETVTKEWRAFRRRMVDSGDTVAKLGREIGDKSLYAYYNFARAASNAAGDALRAGGAQTDVMGRRVGPSLADIWEPIRGKGEEYYSAFQEYLFHRHNIDRMSRDDVTRKTEARAALEIFDEGAPELARMPESDLMRLAAEGDYEAQERVRLLEEYHRAQAVHNKPVFGPEVTAQDSADAVSRYELKYPEFRELAEQVYQYNRNLMQYRVDSGLLTRGQADHIERVYPHYVPTFRLTEGESVRAKKQGQRVSKTIQRAEGGTADLQPIHRAMAEQTFKTIREAAKNRFGTRLLNDAMGKETRKGAKKYIQQITDAVDYTNEDTFDWTEDPTPKNENTFTVYMDGKAYQMTVDRGLYEGFEALSPEEKDLGALVNKVRSGANLFKSLTTGRNPMFMVKNFFRDLQEAGLYSRDLKAWAQNYPLALREIATDGEWWQRYQALGGVYSSIFDYQEGYKVDEKDHGALRRNLIDRVEALNMAVEQAPRLAEFMAQAKKNGTDSMDSLMDAMLAAADVTTNFGRSGDWGKFLNQTFVPFLNPAIQGLDKMGRTFLGKKEGKDWLKLILRCALLGVALRVVNELLNKDQPGWEDIRDSDKDVYWMIHVGNGQYLRIPKGRDMSVIQMGADRIGDALRGEEVDIGGTLGTMANQIAPPNPLENNILAAWMGADLLDPESPGKTWYGGDIESQRLQKYEPGQRYDEKTDAFSKWLGGVLNLSPKKINYLLNQYTGVVGDFVLPLMTPAGDKNPLAPFKSAFVLDSVTSNKISGEFYDTGDRITYAKNGGDGAMAVVSRFWNSQSKAVSDIYAHIREIENSDLPNKEKLEQVREAKAILNGIQKNALESLETYEAAAREFYTGNSDAELDEAYREANRKVFGAEYAIREYNKKVYEKAVTLNKEQGLSFDDFLDIYMARREIEETEGISSAEKRTRFIQWMEANGFDQWQRKNLVEAFNFYTHIPAGETVIERYGAIADKAGISEEQLLAAYEAQKNVKGDKDEDGKTVYLSAARKKKEAVDKATQGLSKRQREKLYSLFKISEQVWDEETASGPLLLPRGDGRPGLYSPEEPSGDVRYLPKW